MKLSMLAFCLALLEQSMKIWRKASRLQCHLLTMYLKFLVFSLLICRFKTARQHLKHFFLKILWGSCVLVWNQDICNFKTPQVIFYCKIRKHLSNSKNYVLPVFASKALLIQGRAYFVQFILYFWCCCQWILGPHIC